jgi:hypothetical protein
VIPAKLGLKCKEQKAKYFLCCHFKPVQFIPWGMRQRSWLRHCATSRKVAGSIPDGVIGFFHWPNPSGHTVALGLTQPLTEMSTRDISWGGKGGRCVGLTTLPPLHTIVLKSVTLNLMEHSGLLQACNGISVPLPFTVYTVHPGGGQKKDLSVSVSVTFEEISSKSCQHLRVVSNTSEVTWQGTRSHNFHYSESGPYF